LGLLLLKIHKIVFSPERFTTIDPSNCADVSKTLARFSAPIFFPPAFRVVILLKTEPALFGNVGFFVYIHSKPLDGGRIHQKTVQPLE
jgi:hypothetical protein